MRKLNSLALPLALASLVLTVSSGWAKRSQDTAIETNIMEADGQNAVQPAGSKTAQKPAPEPVVVPAGTVLTVRTTNALSSKTSQTGEGFVATLEQPVEVGGKTVLPKGTTVNGKVVEAKAQGKIKGEGRLDLELTSLSPNGQTYEVRTSLLDDTVKGKGKRSATTAGGGAGAGALIGGLAGGAKGLGIGILAGAGAGVLGGAVTGNKQVEIPAESVLTFTLSAPLTLPPAK